MKIAEMLLWIDEKVGKVGEIFLLFLFEALTLKKSIETEFLISDLYVDDSEFIQKHKI